MSTPQQLISQPLADAWAIAAQRYAGYFYGYETRARQQGDGAVWPDYEKPWQEPLVFEDDCEFCRVTTDERIEERIAGFQAAIDIEVLRGKYAHYEAWRWTLPPDEHEDTPARRRQFIELYQDVPNPKRETGWRRKALNLTKLPPHLKRRLCVEWNHLLRDWLEENKNVFYYDFEEREIKPRPTPRELAADPEDQQALDELAEDDRAFAEAPNTGDSGSLEEQIAEEYEAGLF